VTVKIYSNSNRETREANLKKPARHQRKTALGKGRMPPWKSIGRGTQKEMPITTTIDIGRLLSQRGGVSSTFIQKGGTGKERGEGVLAHSGQRWSRAIHELNSGIRRKRAFCIRKQHWRGGLSPGRGSCRHIQPQSPGCSLRQQRNTDLGQN